MNPIATQSPLAPRANTSPKPSCIGEHVNHTHSMLENILRRLDNAEGVMRASGQSPTAGANGVDVPGLEAMAESMNAKAETICSRLENLLNRVGI